MSDLDPLFPRHGNSGPAPEVTPPEKTLGELLAEFLRTANIDGTGTVSQLDWVRFQLRALGVLK